MEDRKFAADKGFKWLKESAILFALIALIIIFSVITPAFMSFENLLNVARQISFIGIAAVGMMFVILTGGIDLSIGSLVQVVNILCAALIVQQDWPVGLAVAICFMVALLSGFINGLLITKIKIPPLIATLATMNILNGAAFLISNGLPIFGFPEEFSIIGQGYISFLPIPVLVMIIVFVIGWFILKKTYIGRSFYAIGGNEEASRLSGLNVNFIKVLAYVSIAFLACMAGLIMLSRLNSGTPNTGKGFEFQVITAVVLGGVSVSGGVGKIFGVIIGVFIIGVLNNGLILANLNSYWQYVVNGLVLIVAVGMDCYSKNNAGKAKRLLPE